MVVTLAEDLMRDVLERLPVKSLMRFKCVKRSWNALFKTHNFVSRHRQRQIDERLMIFNTDENTHERNPHIIQILCNEPPHFQVQHLQYPFPLPDNYSLFFLKSFGHCNGVFLLFGGIGREAFMCGAHGIDYIHQTFIWNPATREAKVVPPPPNEEPVDEKSIVLSGCWGFGADPNTLNDLKVVNFSFFFDNENRPRLYLEVYNVSTNSWTVIHDDANDILDPPITTVVSCSFLNTAFANGVYYWLSCDGTYILCFDFRHNQFRKLKTPPTVIPNRGCYIIKANDDSIAYSVYQSLSDDYNRVEIWILKQDSWTKKYNIEPLELGINIYAVWKDGAEFLGGYAYSSLVSYNSDAQSVCQFQILPDLFDFFIYKYVESIVPLSI